jgi:hypothetical protein
MPTRLDLVRRRPWVLALACLPALLRAHEDDELTPPTPGMVVLFVLGLACAAAVAAVVGHLVHREAQLTPRQRKLLRRLRARRRRQRRRSDRQAARQPVARRVMAWCARWLAARRRRPR